MKAFVSVKRKGRWKSRLTQGALPALLGVGLVLFAAQTAMEAYRSFVQLEGSRSSGVILASRRILDEAMTVESTLRKIEGHTDDFSRQDEQALRETLSRLINSLRLARDSFEANPEVNFRKRSSDILSLTRGMIVAIDEEAGRRPDGYLHSLASDVYHLNSKFRLLRDDLDRKSASYITDQSDLMMMSLSAMEKMFFSLLGAVLSVLVLLFLNHRATAKAEFRADHDVMTGALNRRAYENWIEEMASVPNKPATAIMILDLDDFKDINDEFGHLAGDVVIKTFVQSVMTQFGPETRVVRWGGDEFVLVLSTEGFIEAGAVTMLRAAFAGLQSSIEIDGATVHVRASAGVAFCPHDSNDLRETMQLADLALFSAKSRGKGRLQFFDCEMQNERHRVHALRDRLRRALGDGELTLYWQPQVDIAYPHVHSDEALIRWYDPRLGRMIPPGEFIPIAETSDLIIAIDNFVLDEAIRTGARWSQMWAHPPTVAVNVSAMHFQQRDFVEQVRDLLRMHGMHPSQLELEITEGVVLGDNAEVKRNLDGLAQLGVHIALDDFGTGYSNIAYLSHLKPDRLKIDQTFVRRLGNNPHMRSLVAAIIGIGRAIDCEVVAEGVETEEQLAEIKALGCHLVQGYYFARPMPRADFEAWRASAGYSDDATNVQQLRQIADRLAAAEVASEQRSDRLASFG